MIPVVGKVYPDIYGSTLTGSAGAVAAPLPAPAPAGTATIPGYTPDYTALLATDPSYLAWQNNFKFTTDQAAAQRKAALQALALGYGGLPSNVTDQYGDVDQGTLDLAGQNQQSDEARLQRTYDTSVEGLKRSLAARGALSSGDLQYGLDQADLAKASNEYDLGTAFSTAYQNAINAYLNTEQTARSGQYGAIQGAESAEESNPLNQPTPAQTATLHPDWQAKYGEPVYVGPDGALYAPDSNGNLVPYLPPAAVSGGASGTPYTPPDVSGWASNPGVSTPTPDRYLAPSVPNAPTGAGNAPLVSQILGKVLYS